MAGELIGIGIDLVDIARADEMIERFGDRALRRMLTVNEIEYVVSMSFPAMHFAARIAAKEAGFKALQALPDAAHVTWRDLEVLRATGGRPTMKLHGAAEDLVRRHGPLSLHLSLTHTELSAGAVAVLLKG